MRNYKGNFADKCVFIYGIAKIKIYSYNKEVNTLYTVVSLLIIFHLSVQRLENPRTNIVYCSAPIQVTIYLTLLLYNILLPINQYSGSITIKMQ